MQKQVGRWLELSKLDFKFRGDLYKIADGTHVPDDEWMAFLASDDAFAAMLPIYRDKCVELGCDAEQIAAINKTIARLYLWRAANHGRLESMIKAGD